VFIWVRINGILVFVLLLFDLDGLIAFYLYVNYNKFDIV